MLIGQTKRKECISNVSSRLWGGKPCVTTLKTAAKETRKNVFISTAFVKINARFFILTPRNCENDKPRDHEPKYKMEKQFSCITVREILNFVPLG